ILNPIDRSQKAGIIFLDCCRDTLFAKAVPSLSIAVWPKLMHRGTFVAFSTAPGATASDGLAGRSNSPFVESLAQHISAENRRTSDLMIDIRNDVYEKTDRQQMPWESSSLLTPFAFNQTELDLDGQEDLATAAKLRVLGLSEKSDNPELIESFL